MTRDETADFRQYLVQCTDAQVLGVLEKEREAGRKTEIRLAKEEAKKRGLL